MPTSFGRSMPTCFGSRDSARRPRRNSILGRLAVWLLGLCLAPQLMLAQAPGPGGKSVSQRVKPALPAELTVDRFGLPFELGEEVASAVTPETTPPRVCGPDERVKVANTTTSFQSAVCLLNITLGNGTTATNTGFLVGPRTVLTMGQSVYATNTGGWARSIRVTPGRNGRKSPFGAADAVELRAPAAWVNNQSLDYTIGCIKLSAPLGNQAGWFGASSRSDAQLLSTTATVSGYPTGKTPRNSQWTMAGPITGFTGTNNSRFIFPMDVTPGQFGGPVWETSPTPGIAIGIQATESTGSTCFNGALRFTPEIMGIIIGWINADNQP